ncbi:MAG TPA: SPOR domain-containing protein, partial [Devosia sp.]|nr:SPOR domain-containing protein [Devosia sp.]
EGAVATDASVAPVAAATPSSTIPGATEVPALADSAPAYVQLASQRSEADARQSAQNMVTRYGPLFGGANLEVQRVDLGTKGIYYRVRVPANSLEEANMICTNVKAAGGDCFTL